jgi:hypothetical protein
MAGEVKTTTRFFYAESLSKLDTSTPPATPEDLTTVIPQRTSGDLESSVLWEKGNSLAEEERTSLNPDGPHHHHVDVEETTMRDKSAENTSKEVRCRCYKLFSFVTDSKTK